MNRIELKIQLDKLGISSAIYSLYGERDFNKIILEWSSNWRIYSIDERGGEHEKATFLIENEACEYFYNIFIEFKKTMDDFNKKNYVEEPEEKKYFIVSNNGDTIIQKDE